MSEYIYKQLGELVTFQRGKDLPRTSMKNGPYPVIGSNGIIGYHNDFNVQSPCITVGRSGNVGKPYLHLGEAWAHNTCLYVKEFKGCDPLFIYYLLKTLNLERQAGGSAVPTLNRNHIHPLIVKVPKSIEAQKYIATVLFGFDQLISLNSRTNDNLLQQIKILFDYYYDRAENEIGFTELIQVASGGTPKTTIDSYWNGEIPFFTPKDVGLPYTVLTEKKITQEGLCHCNSIQQTLFL